MPAIKDISSFKDSQVYYIPIEIKSILKNEINVKIEFYEPSTQDLYSGKQPGIRVWFNTSAQVLDSRNERVQKAVKMGALKVIPILKHGAKDTILDKYELERNNLAYNSFLYFFQDKLENIPKNKKYHITLGEIRKDHAKDPTKYPVLNTWSYLDLPLVKNSEENKKWKLVEVSDSLQLEMTDLSNFDFKLKTDLTNTQKQEIDDILRELYLSNNKDYEIIKDWLHIDSLKEGRYDFKNIANRCGVVLYGPAGTGKTHTATKVFKKIFEEYFECTVRDFVLSDILGGDRSGTVGGFAHGVSNDLIAESITELRKTRKPVLVFIDEGTDMIKDAKAAWGGRGDDWIEQGQEILKNYLNPKRFPGLIFVIATNLPSTAQMNKTILGNRLEGVEFPYPNKERARLLFRSYFLTKKLSNEENKNPFSNKDLEEACVELGIMCDGIVSVRDMTNFTDKIIKQNHSFPVENLDYNEYKRNIIENTLTLINEDLASVNEKRKNAVEKRNNSDIDLEEEKLLASQKILKVYLEGRTIEEENLRIIARTQEINTQLFVQEYIQLRDRLILFQNRSLTNNDILTNKHGINYSKKLSKYVEEFAEDFNLCNIVRTENYTENISIKNYYYNLLKKLANNLKNYLSSSILNQRIISEIYSTISQLPEANQIFISGIPPGNINSNPPNNTPQNGGGGATNPPSGSSHNTSPNNNPTNHSGIVSGLINSITGIFDNNYLDVNTIIQSYLAYQDAPLSKQEKERTLNATLSNSSALKYAKVLKETKELNAIIALSQKLQKECIDILNHMNLFEISPYTKSQTWSIWDIAKQIYFISHPNETDSNRYRIANPLTDTEKEKEILFRHIGWEIYSNKFLLFTNNHMKPEEEQLNCFSKVNKKKIIEMLVLPSEVKNNDSLPSDQLAELGRLVVEGLINYNSNSINLNQNESQTFILEFESRLTQLKKLWIQNKFFGSKSEQEKKDYYNSMAVLLAPVINDLIRYRKEKYNLNTNVQFIQRIKNLGQLFYNLTSENNLEDSDQWRLVRITMNDLINNLHEKDLN